MALPTLSKTWIFNVGVVKNPMYSGNSATYAAFDMFAFLVGIKKAMCSTTGWVDKDGVAATQNHPWTVVASSDGDSAGATDYWTDYLSFVNNPATPTYRIATNNFAWIVLENDALGNFNFMIGTGNNAAPTYLYAQCVWVSWDGFDVSSPVITDYPTATDGYQLVGTGNVGNYIYGEVGNAVRHDSVFHIAMSTDGECTRIIGCKKGAPVLFWQIEKAKNPITAWTNSIICTARFNNVANKNQGLAADLISSANTVVRLESPFVTRKAYMSSEGYGSSLIATAQRTPGVLDNEYKLYPANLITNYSPAGHLGSIYDLWFTSLSATVGLCFPSSGSRQFLSLGGTVIPWTNSLFYVDP